MSKYINCYYKNSLVVIGNLRYVTSDLQGKAQLSFGYIEYE